MTDSTTSKSLYTTTPRDLPIPRGEHDFISVRQDADSVTPHAEVDSWTQTGTGGGATAQTLILETSGSHKLFLQNSSAPGGGSTNEIKVTRSGVYKVAYSAQISYDTVAGDEQVELGVGSSSTIGTSIVHSDPLERAVRLQAPSGQTAGSVNEHVTGTIVLRLPNDTVLRLYDRVVNNVADVTIQNADITVQRLGRDGQ